MPPTASINPQPTRADSAAPRAVPAVRAPELLAPAGNWDCARAAVENGADAIYFGLDRFNARMRADNFTETDLPALMAFLHRRGVKGYATFNTLVFEDELAEAETCLRAIIAAGVDAAIVQDLGICRLIRQLSPDFPIHASTQMTITSAAGLAVAGELGCCLAVLARECSLREIERIREEAASTAGSSGPLPVEVFVHGALCVAYSGQCLTSEALGGRSANRGECAQACRMPYELISDGKTVPMGDRRYLLSPQDLAGLNLVPELARIGVASLKIEGRLKTPEYVANITRLYREALDRCASGSPVPQARSHPPIPYEMEMAFSRGLHTGWLEGIDNQSLVHARFGKKRGVFLGQVAGVAARRVALRLVAPVKAGDGVVFDGGHPDEAEEGGRVYSVHPRKPSQGEPPCDVELEFGDGCVDLGRIRPGDRVWKTSDPELDKRLRRSFAGDAPRFCRPLDVEVRGEAGQALTVILRDEEGREAEARSAVVLVAAEKRPLSTERLREQLGRLGGTPFQLRRLTNRLRGDVIVPVGELNRVRREVVARLESLRARPRVWTLRERKAAEGIGRGIEAAPDEQPRLTVLVRRQEQLEAALGSGAAVVYCEFEDPKRYGEAVRIVRGAVTGNGSKPEIWVAPPRIAKPGEEWILKQTRASEADGYLVRNYDQLAYFSGDRCFGDFSLNVANRLTAAWLMDRYRLEGLTASYDLNMSQLEALLRAAPPAWLEVTLHQHMPLFHMEHCVFCAFLSQGKDYRDCGRPCDRHEVKLRDRVGAEHVLKADAGCRNTVFHARAQTGAEHASRLIELGLRRFRVEFVHETPAEVRRTLASYAALLRGEMSGSDLWRELKLVHRLGVTHF